MVEEAALAGGAGLWSAVFVLGTMLASVVDEEEEGEGEEGEEEVGEGEGEEGDEVEEEGGVAKEVVSVFSR